MDATLEHIFAGRFRAARLMKRGLGVETFLGTDDPEDREVIIKAARAGEVSAGTQQRLEHEASVLREVRSPWLTPLLHFGRQDGWVFLVTPFVSGITLEARLRSGPLLLEEAFALAQCVLLALEEAHDRGILHRDVKPSNVIVDERPPLERATLIDFGLARSARLEGSIRDHPVGTARYISPEQAGLLRHDVGPRSDLYSFGATLFECLAGRPAFLGDTVAAVLRQHLTERPPELRALGIAVPRAVDELIQRLLRKDPRERYQSARAVLGDLDAIRAALRGGMAEPELVLDLQDRRSAISEPAFVGRQAEIDALVAASERARAGHGALVALEAESGGGKSRLLDEFALHAARRGVLVLRGQSLDRATPRPLEALAGAAADLVTAVRAEPALGAAVRARVGEFATAAVTALPELSEILGEQAPVSLGLEAHGEARTLAALIAVLDALGSPARPAAILLDDCQWADELTLKLVAERHRRPADSHTLVVVAFRSEEVGPGHPLRAAASQRLALAPLEGDDLRRLLESMAGALPQEAIGFVGELSAGSPFLATAILEGLVEMGALRAGDAGWTVEMRALADAHSSRRAALVLARRIERLPPGAQRVLVAGAVLGRSFDLHHAGALARQPLAATMDAVAEARRRHLVWASADGTGLTFVHDKIRDALLSSLPSEERRELHLSAATRLEAAAANAIFDLAYHFDAAGRPERALPYALRAAAQARSQHALQPAELHYRIAWRGAGAADDATRRGIAEALGEVLMLRGSYEEAGPYLEQARELAPTELARAQAEARLGELVFRRGDVMASVPIFERALHLLGRRRPSNAWWLALMALRELSVQILHTLFPRLFVARRGIDGGERDLLEARIYGRLAYCTYMGRGLVRTVPEQLRQLNLAERYTATPELAQACITHAVVAQMLHMPRRFDRFAARSLELRRSQGDIWGQGQTLHFMGMAYFGGSNFARAIAQCREAIRLLERAGDRWEENAARFHIACSQYYLGELGPAVEGAQRNYRLSIDIGDLTLASSSLKPWALASGGEIPEDVIRTEMARPDPPGQTFAMLCIAEAVRLLHLARHAEAVTVLERAYGRLWKTFLVTFHVLDLFAWLATARRLVWEKASPPEARARRALLRGADRAAVLARLFGRLWRNDLPHALRESALLAAIHGRERRARRLLQRSLAQAERQGARYERAQTLLAWSRVGAAFAWPGARDQGGVALAELRAMGAKMALGEPLAGGAHSEPTLSLADRFAALLEAGRKIASALSHDAIHDAVRQSALDLLRGERCVLVEIGENDALACATHPADEPFSRTLVALALAAGHPLTLSEGSPESAGDSAVFAGVRSALCAPIFVRGRARLCLYTTHAKVGGLFGEDDERLAGFIAAIAGAALENAEGFAEVQVLTRTLEQRVQERTAQLSDANRELAAKKLQLEQRNSEIQGATEQKSAFLANMSHELRTPLNAILGFTRLTLKKSGDALPPLQRENLKKVEKSAVDLIGIVSDILDLSKVEAGKLSVRADSFELGELVDEVLASAAPLVGERPLVLQKRIPASVPKMLTDRVRLKQIVLNLISNAIKFTPSGDVTVDVQHDPAADRIRIAVIDTGIGIGETDADRIFEPFRQADDVDARRAGGTGLGLAIVRRLSHLLGGTVALESHVGHGSRFTVEVPRVLAFAVLTSGHGESDARA